jgi:hypothetical protein
MLWMLDKPRDPCLAPTWQSATEHFQIKIQPLQTVIAGRNEKRSLKGNTLRETFEEVYTTIEHLANTVDGLEGQG